MFVVFYAPGADICELSPLVVSRSIFKLENFLVVLEVPYERVQGVRLQFKILLGTRRSYSVIGP